MTENIELIVADKIKQVVDKLNAIYNFNMSNPKFYWDVNGTTAGLAKSKTMSVHFNLKLAKQNWDDFINNTVPHEVCHIAAWQWAKFFKKPIPKPHGACWNLMMREVGCKPTRTHEYDVTEVKRNSKRYLYDCGCSEKTEVSTVIHNRIKNGRIYQCLKCKQRLTNGTLKLTKYFSKSSPNGTTQTKDTLS